MDAGHKDSRKAGLVKSILSGQGEDERDDLLMVAMLGDTERVVGAEMDRAGGVSLKNPARSGQAGFSPKQTTRFRPCAFALYRAWSAAPISSSSFLPWRGKSATPMLTVMGNGGAPLQMN